MLKGLMRLRNSASFLRCYQNEAGFLSINYQKSSLKQLGCHFSDSSMEEKPIRSESVLVGSQLFRLPKKGSKYIEPSLETSIKYLASKEYFAAYGSRPVWYHYRRNFGGHFPPKYTRKTCIHKDTYRTSNPCPICRDRYLLVHYQNAALLRQFTSVYDGSVLPTAQTGLCRKVHQKLLLEIEKARDIGLLETSFPFRLYDYTEHYNSEELGGLRKAGLLIDISTAEDPVSAILHAKGDQESQAKDELSVSELQQLPASLRNILEQSVVIPHATEIDNRPKPTEIETPKLPNRYIMEETYKQRLKMRKKSKSLLMY